MNLISQWYTPKDNNRFSEIAFARKANEESGLFESITYLDGDKKRWSFRELFDFASEQHDGEVCGGDHTGRGHSGTSVAASMASWSW